MDTNGNLRPFDVTRPNAARVYDALLGGKDNFEPDRQAATRLEQLIPGSTRTALDNRAFLQRAVGYLVVQGGIRQFIDIGSGLPTMRNVHEVVHEVIPSARVVYVDYDPMVLAHGRAHLAGTNVRIIQADFRFPDDVLQHPGVAGFIDFNQPVALLMFAVLHFVPDDELPYWIVGKYTERLAPGSYLALSHITDDDVSRKASEAAQDVYREASTQVAPRSHMEVEQFFDGMTLLETGLVDIRAWPTYTPGYEPGTPRLMYGGLAYKRRHQYVA